MHTIIPAIIPQSEVHLRETMQTIGIFTNEMQIDIVDGKFVPFVSWPYLEGSDVHILHEFTEEYMLEVDLMIERPEEVIVKYLDAGVQSVVVHLESTHALEQIVAYKERYNFRLGLSISNETPLEVLLQQLHVADYVQLMGIRHIGSQGQPFDSEVLTRIHEIKKYAPTCMVSIDGSVNKDTLVQLQAAGADRLVSGSAILASPDPAKTFLEFSEMYKQS